MPADRYRFAYGDDTPYSHAVGLLSAHTYVPGGVVVDLGCGYGAIAEPVRDLGLSYLGVDLEPAGLDDLRARGFEAALADLRDAGRLGARLEALLSGRDLAAITALDVLEHLANGPAVLAALREVAIRAGRGPLVVSIPNVTHLDLAAKALIGRWDVTPTGLLDETHVSLYGPGRLATVLEAAGWAEVGADDFELAESDQHTPADAAVLAATPLHDLLAGVRRRAAPGATTNQFVRAYVPVSVPVSVPAPAPAPGGEAPFLSALVLVGPSEDRLLDTLVALDAQGPGRVQAVLLTADPSPAERSRLVGLLARFAGGLAEAGRVVAVPGSGPHGRAVRLDAGARAADGAYLTVLDDGAVPFAHFVDTLARLAAERPGAVLRSLALAQPLRERPFPGGRSGDEPAEGAVTASSPAFDLLAHCRAGGSPPGSYALPRTCVRDLGLSFAAGPAGLEDDQILARAAQWCGVHEDTTTAVLLQRRPGGADARAVDRDALLASLDAEPVLLPAGSLARLAQLARPAAEAAPGDGAEVAGLEAALAAARAELADLRASTSWRLTAPLRRLSPRRAGPSGS